MEVEDAVAVVYVPIVCPLTTMLMVPEIVAGAEKAVAATTTGIFCPYTLVEGAVNVKETGCGLTVTLKFDTTCEKLEYVPEGVNVAVNAYGVVEAFNPNACGVLEVIETTVLLANVTG